MSGRRTFTTRQRRRTRWGPVENPPPRIREDFRHEERVTASAGMPISGGLQSAGCCTGGEVLLRGEFGSVSGQNYLHGFMASIALFPGTDVSAMYAPA
jgi:hypothetical protein